MILSTKFLEHTSAALQKAGVVRWQSATARANLRHPEVSERTPKRTEKTQKYVNIIRSSNSMQFIT